MNPSKMTLRSEHADVFIPDDVSFPQFIFDKIKQWPNRKALVYGDTEKSITFSELRVICARFANGLLNHGFCSGDVMSVVAPTIPEYTMTLLSVPMFGGVVTGMNPMWTVEEMVTQISDAKAKFILTVPQLLPKMKEVAKKCSHVKEIFTIGKTKDHKSFDDLVSEGHDKLPLRVFDPKHQVALMHYSSGTTGMPKGVMNSHYNMVAALSILGPSGTPVFSEGHEVSYTLFPMFHVGGSFGTLAAICNGVTSIFYPSFDFEVFLQCCQKYKITTQLLPPPVVVRLAKDPLVDKYDLSSMHTIITGAAPVSAGTTREVMNRLGVKYFLQVYGMTEATGLTHLTDRYDIVPGAAGKTIPNVETKIVDIDTGKTLGPHQRGEVCMRGPVVMLGYFQRNYETKATIDTEGWLHSGDIGYYDETGNFFIVDRLKELVKYKGFQVPPAELEALLLTHPAVAEAAVIGMPDENVGELPRAYVALKQDKTVSAHELQKFVDDRVAPYKRLRGGVFLVSDIPKSQSGKLLRRQLKDQAIKAAKAKL